MIDFCYDEAETAVEKERNRGDAEISAFLTNRSLRREKEEDMKKFLKYVVPSVLAFALSGIYAIVDGFL